MGGGISRHELAAAVSEAGGLGTIAVTGASSISREVALARSLTGRPIAVNILLPFARPDWFDAAAQADVVVTFWGRPRRRTPGPWMHQCGSVAEVRAAVSAGADAVILQGVEAGGHVRGKLPALELLEQTRTACGSDYPLLLAGGIATRSDVDAALHAGAAAVVAGSRFLLSDESHAHPAYKRRVLSADRTILTDLFGFGWPAAHRVVPNAAIEQLKSNGHTPMTNRAVNRISGLGSRHAPAGLQGRLIEQQRPDGRILTPQAPLDDAWSNLVEAGPLYAGESALRMSSVKPAAQIVTDLAG